MSDEVRSLEHEITTLAAHIHAATCRWLELIARYDRSEGWFAAGAKSCAHWVSWSCGISPGAAREHVRVAHALESLPLVRRAFAEGQLSYSKVRAITRVDDLAEEAGLVALALDASASQLERVVQAHRRSLSVDVAAEKVHAERFLSWRHDEDGALVIHGRIPAEEGAVLIAAIEAAMEQAPAAGVDAEEPVSYGGRRADALVVLADTALASETLGRQSAERHQVVVHVDAMTLAAPADESSGSGCELEHGPVLPAETARRLCCDASIARIVERDGKAPPPDAAPAPSPPPCDVS